VSYSFGTMDGRPGAWISSRLATSFSTSAALHDAGAVDVSAPIATSAMLSRNDAVAIVDVRELHLNDTLSGSLALTCTGTWTCQYLLCGATLVTDVMQVLCEGSTHHALEEPQPLPDV